MQNNTNTATETYQTRQREVAALLDFIRCELEVHAAKAARSPQNWGHAGDLGHVRQTLKETLAFLVGGNDEEATAAMIEDTLADAVAAR